MLVLNKDYCFNFDYCVLMVKQFNEEDQKHYLIFVVDSQEVKKYQMVFDSEEGVLEAFDKIVTGVKAFSKVCIL